MKQSNRYIIYMTVTLLLLACTSEQAPTPKPRTYPRIDFPEKNYHNKTVDQCKFSFDIPKYAVIKKEQNFFKGDTPDPCWFDINFEGFNGKLHCSYYPINNSTSFDSLVSDAFELVGKHRIKANYRDEFRVEKENGVSGLLFELGGPVASPMQFFLTDTSHHFFRGALYFDNKVNPDSMRIVHEFIKEDISKLIDSFSWNQ